MQALYSGLSLAIASSMEAPSSRDSSASSGDSPPLTSVTAVARALSPAKVSSVTITEPETEGGQASVLVIVPDSQLSLAIGKRGQNARLAAKLTGLRVDIKSEGEVEEERRREEEELAEGRLVLATFPEATPHVVDKLVSAGLFSPARIARAGLSVLAAVPGVGERKAAALFEAAQAWVAEDAAAAADARAAEESAESGEAFAASESEGKDEPPAAQA